MRSAPWPEAVTVLAEGWIEDRLQYLQHTLLDEPVKHGRYPQLPDSAPALGDHVSSYRHGLVGPRKQLLPDLCPVRP